MPMKILLYCTPHKCMKTLCSDPFLLMEDVDLYYMYKINIFIHLIFLFGFSDCRCLGFFLFFYLSPVYRHKNEKKRNAVWHVNTNACISLTMQESSAVSGGGAWLVYSMA